jgi:hypothetical protein
VKRIDQQAQADMRAALGESGSRDWSQQVAQLSTTVFSGTPQAWLDFLARPPADRVDGWYELESWEGGWKLLRGSESRWPEWIERGWQISWKRLRAAEETAELDGWFADVSVEAGLRLCSAPDLPASCLVERMEGARGASMRLLWNTSVFTRVEESLRQVGDGEDAEFFGRIWPALRLLWLQLLYPDNPRDHFTERITLTVRWAYLHLVLLYERGRDLRPNRAGKAWEESLLKEFYTTREFLSRAFPFWRLLQQLTFMRSLRQVREAENVASIYVRDYLDVRYLRLGVADLMPGVPAWLQAMPYIWKRPRKILCTRPQLGRFGIIDEEDLAAWRKVEKPFEQVGFRLIGQLGMGQFGRVYEAVNLGRGDLPERVAIKVDRIRKGHKKEAIQAAETIMEIGRDLAASPHVIRIFDAGNLKGLRFTYHVLQLVEGDTLDHLLGIAGEEHASVLRPGGRPRSEPEIKREYLRALRDGHGEAWRKVRQSPPFLYSPNLRQLLDLLTSIVLWMEEVHSLGYAVNDLKNGNLMINRRGQFKAIDLDSYGRISSSLDKLADFFFLGISTVHLLTGQFGVSRLQAGGESDLEAIARALEVAWMELPESESRERKAQRAGLLEFFQDYLERCRSGFYARNPDKFAGEVDRLISLKRQLFSETLILD